MNPTNAGSHNAHAIIVEKVSIALHAPRQNSEEDDHDMSSTYDPNDNKNDDEMFEVDEPNDSMTLDQFQQLQKRESLVRKFLQALEASHKAVMNLEHYFDWQIAINANTAIYQNTVVCFCLYPT